MKQRIYGRRTSETPNGDYGVTDCASERRLPRRPGRALRGVGGAAEERVSGTRGSRREQRRDATRRGRTAPVSIAVIVVRRYKVTHSGL